MTRLIYLSPLPWASFAQRPHQFVEWFHARTGAAVLWVDPYPTRLPALADLGRVRQALGAGAGVAREVPAWLSVVRPRALPLEPLPYAGVLNALLWQGELRAIARFLAGGETLLALGKPSELALQVLARHPGVPSLYDAMDDFAEFYSGLSRFAMARRERRLAALAARITVSSTLLAQRFSGWGEKLTLALNACAVEALPAPRAAAAGPGRPVLGYVGTIAQWFDWPLVVALARANPTLCVRLIGPVLTPFPGHLPGNIQMLPACDHASAIRAMQDFSVGLIPFQLNSLTASVDPIKYYEYQALGLPVISTRFGEMALRQAQAGVFSIDHDSDLRAAAELALAYRYPAGHVEQFRANNSWRARFDAAGILP
jgi:hypothetical protein